MYMYVHTYMHMNEKKGSNSKKKRLYHAHCKISREKFYGIVSSVHLFCRYLFEAEMSKFLIGKKAFN